MEKFGDYTILEKIATGGMAEIYKAQDQVGQPVAIKKILPELATEQKFVQMFLDEVRIVIQLHHPNIVELSDFGLVDSSYYFAMEWVDGKSLADVIMAQRKVNVWMPPEVMLLMAIDVCEGLAYAHEKRDRRDQPLNIIHRDLSPPNIMVNRSGVFKIADFGIAQVRDKNVKTLPGIIRGKFSYMSPEQSLGRALDVRSDLFSMGIVFFESLTLTRLFLRKNESETLEAVRKCQVPPLSDYRRDVPAPLEQLLRRVLASNPASRPNSSAELTAELRGLLKTYYPHAGRWMITDFLKQVFPDEAFESKDKRPPSWAQGPAVVVEPTAERPLWVQWLHDFRYPVSMMWALSVLVVLEVLVRLI